MVKLKLNAYQKNYDKNLKILQYSYNVIESKKAQKRKK